MSDREPLEWAAKAAGIEVIRSRLEDSAHRDLLVANSVRNPFQKYGPWNPLTDDGDALRLAVKLGLTIVPNYHVSHDGFGVCAFTEPEDSFDFCAPTRRAIVRAAASIGQQKGE